jgi:hypothetical protein
MNNKTRSLSLTGDTEDIQILQNDYNLAELALQFECKFTTDSKESEYNLRKYFLNPCSKQLTAMLI